MPQFAALRHLTHTQLWSALRLRAITCNYGASDFRRRQSRSFCVTGGPAKCELLRSLVCLECKYRSGGRRHVVRDLQGLETGNLYSAVMTDVKGA